MTEPSRILIIKMSSLGDVIHALPSLYALRSLYPKARITWAVHPAFAGILPETPWIDEIYLVDRKKIKNLPYLLNVRRDLHARHFDLVIDLQMIAKSALIAALSGCSRRIGYWEAREGSGLVSHPVAGLHKEGHIIERLLDVIRFLGWQGEDIEFPLRSHEAEKASIQKKLKNAGVTGPYAVLVPGTRWEAKNWPAPYWGELARRLSEKKIFTVIIGTEKEQPLADTICRLSPSPYTVSLMGKTNLLELAALEEGASMHLSGDTGPLHIANAVKTPIIALFGPTLPDRSGPYGNNKSSVLLADHPGTAETKMDTISVDAVYDLFMKKWEDGGGYHR